MRLLFLSLLSFAFTVRAAVFADPIDTPAPIDPVAIRSPLIAIAKASDTRYVAVGLRGLILVSDDAGKNWQQSRSPVSDDLVGVYFVDANQGWVCGHDAVILHTADGGRTWMRQIDYRKTVPALHAQAQQLATTGAAKAELLKNEAEIYERQPSVRPFLDVWFENERTGFAIGGFNLIFRTDDGGNTWNSWFDRTDNERVLHLHAMGRAGGDLYIVGEQGLVMRLDSRRQTFVKVEQPYPGSYFGLVARDRTLIAYGLRGNAYRTRDGGKTWQKLDTRTEHLLSAASYLPDGRLVIISQYGEVLVSRDDGDSFDLRRAPRDMQLHDLAPLGSQGVIAVGDRGVQPILIP